MAGVREITAAEFLKVCLFPFFFWVRELYSNCEFFSYVASKFLWVGMNEIVK